MRRIFAVVLGLALLVAAPAVATADTTTSQINNQQAVKYVISRGLSQRGVPFLYGGGNAAGPTRGTGAYANTVGFDASGLMVYSFAGVGLKLPRSSADQYLVGRKIAPAQAKPGDLIFYGPNGTQSVAMYLGNGQMLEATEPAVTVSAVRTKDMAPYLSRMIDW
ncbi:MAG TPA: NlpC/P60 family peptidoglycan-binding protein RipD [Mycobacterium sp.]|nr:NlpC/P60 family peptidoglycan-binding protein RipD [Mycobacterium sp.]